MSKRIKRDDYLYREALSWMAYRYAIGITESLGRSGESEAERYRMFRDIEFDTEEFHALVNALIDFLKRKKIKDIVDLRDNYREADLIWLSRNYAMGRHSYAASHCDDIIPYIDSWTRAYNKDGLIKYERVKVRIDKPQGFFRKAFLVEDYIVEDNIQ